MEFCQDHWSRLRKKIDEAGLSALVADSGQRAAEQFARSAEGEDTFDTFDPLMYAHWAIVAHAAELVGGAVIAHDGCPICFLNAEHERTCSGCDIPRENGFDFFLDKAADAAKDHLEYLKEGSS